MQPSFSAYGGLLARLARVAVVATVLTVVAMPDVIAAQIRCSNAGVEVYEGQSGVVSTLCFSDMSLGAGGISVAPDSFFITSILRLGDTSDTINETADQLRASFTFPGSSHPGYVEPRAPLVDFADTSFRLSLAFSTPPAHHGGIIDSGTAIITGFVLWNQVGGGISSGASDPFSLTVVVRDVPEPETASLMLSGAAALCLVNLGRRSRRRARRGSGQTAIC